MLLEHAAAFGLTLVGERRFDADEAVIETVGKKYTFGWLALSVQVGTAVSPLATGALAAVSLPGAFLFDGALAWVAGGLLFFGARGLLARRD